MKRLRKQTQKGETTMADLLDMQNLVSDTLMRLMNHATQLGNISQSECRKMSDASVQAFNAHDKASLILFLRNYGKKFPVSFATCESLIYQINSQL